MSAGRRAPSAVDPAPWTGLLLRMLAAALAVWPLIAGGIALSLIVLFVGVPLERRIRERARHGTGESDRQDAETRR